MKTNRWYYKCADCLEPVAIDEQYNTLTCDCGGNLRLMGKVTGDSWSLHQEQSACDYRCTDAAGPQCNCSCGGVNHGSHRVVSVLVAQGMVSVVPRSDLEVRKARTAEYRAAITAARNAMPESWRTAYQAKREGRWVPNFGDFLSARDHLDAVNHAAGLKTHSGRMKALRAIALKYAPETIAA